MELKEIVMSRYATKLFGGNKIPPEKITELLELVRWAPSGLNIQPWKIKVVADEETKEVLSSVTWDEPQIKSCSHLLVFCADTDFEGLRQKLGESMKANGVPDRVWRIVMGIAEEMSEMSAAEWLTYAKCQVYLTLSYAILAAKDLGFDSCPMSHFKPDEYAKALGLPANLVPTILCAVGYAADQQHGKWRYPLKDIVLS
jgi:nitroreductase/dihydropteridine reductase